MSRMHRARNRPGLLYIAIALAAIPAYGQRPERVRDSAGIRIIEFSMPHNIPTWTIDTAPIFDIGAQDDENYQLGHGGGSGGYISALPDGRFVLADEPLIRMFDGNGRFLSRFSGRGEGPGEFQSTPRLAPYRGDSILAWGTFNIAVFDHDGKVGRAFIFRHISEYLSKREVHEASDAGVQGALTNGTIVIKGAEIINLDQSGFIWATTSVTLHRPDGTLFATIDKLKSLELLRGPSYLKGPFERYLYLPPNFFRGPLVAGLFKNSFYLAHSERLGFSIYDSTGKLTTIIRARDLPRAPTKEEKDANTDAWLGATGASKGRGEVGTVRGFEDLAFAPRRPAFAATVVDGDGNVWFSDFELDQRLPKRGAYQWTVVSPKGMVIGRMTTTGMIRWVSSDRIAYEVLDADDVPHLKLFRLRR